VCDGGADRLVALVWCRLERLEQVNKAKAGEGRAVSSASDACRRLSFPFVALPVIILYKGSCTVQKYNGRPPVKHATEQNHQPQQFPPAAKKVQDCCFLSSSRILPKIRTFTSRQFWWLFFFCDSDGKMSFSETKNVFSWKSMRKCDGLEEKCVHRLWVKVFKVTYLLVMWGKYSTIKRPCQRDQAKRFKGQVMAFPWWKQRSMVRHQICLFSPWQVVKHPDIDALCC